MPTYLALAHWTKEGVEKIKESPSRLDAAKKAFASSGLKVKDFYMLLGRYDFALIVEAKDDAALARAFLTVAAQGSVRTETLRAFTEDEYRKIISGLS
jgi:uncharacterized protein with GYD domain